VSSGDSGEITVNQLATPTGVRIPHLPPKEKPPEPPGSGGFFVPWEQVRPATVRPDLRRCRLTRSGPVLPACRSIPRGVTGGNRP
jgi:hypothetical protein